MPSWAVLLRPPQPGLTNKLASGGMSIIVVWSDMPEVLAISDRVVVLKEGRMTGVLPALTPRRNG